MAKRDEHKTSLSKHLLQMKFMQKSVVRKEQENSEEERQRHIDDEHWVLDIPELTQEETRYRIEPSHWACAQLQFGRQSYKGFNAEIEKLMKNKGRDAALEAAEAKEKETRVDDQEMVNRFSSLVGTITKKFLKKRDRSKAEEEEEEELEDVPERKKKKRKKEFLKPQDD